MYCRRSRESMEALVDWSEYAHSAQYSCCALKSPRCWQTSALPLSEISVLSNTAYINFCFSEKRLLPSMPIGIKVGSKTSLRSCARACAMTARCQMSHCLSCLRVGNILASRLMPFLNSARRSGVRFPAIGAKAGVGFAEMENHSLLEQKRWKSPS
jgi:hypothetical protein